VDVSKSASQKYKIYRHQMHSFKLLTHQNLFPAGALPWTLLGELTMLPQAP